ncbi:MAG: hypothetical protein LW699_11330 [Pirellula sp.]|nr:hypothetical protein [Pirellula sp.]
MNRRTHIGDLSFTWDANKNKTSLPANLRPSGSTSAMNLNWDSDNKLRSTAFKVSAR